MTDLDISIIIPTRDRRVQLRRALASALAQRGVRFEVIVVDDGSTDGTADELRALREPRVRLLRHEASRGVAAARNRGLAAARSPWVAFLDDDDVWSPHWLHTAVGAGKRDGSVLVFGAAWLVDHELRLVGVQASADPRRVHRLLARDNVIGGPSMVVMRADTVRDAGGFNEAFDALADWDLWLRLRGRAFSAVREPLVAYCLHPGNMHIVDPYAVISEFGRLCAVHDDRDLRPASFVRWVADEAAAGGDRRQGAALYRLAWRMDRRPSHVVAAAAALTGRRRRRPARQQTDRPGWLDVSLAGNVPRPAVRGSRSAR